MTAGKRGAAIPRETDTMRETLAIKPGMLLLREGMEKETGGTTGSEVGQTAICPLVLNSWGVVLQICFKSLLCKVKTDSVETKE